MPRVTVRLVSLGFVLLFAGLASSDEVKPLTNDDIKKMVAGGFSDAVILNAIAANDTDFDVSVDALTGLKSAGVSEKVISTMLEVTARKRPSPPPAAPPARPAESAPPPAAPPPAALGLGKNATPAGMNLNAMQQMVSSLGLGNTGMGVGPSLDPSQMPTVFLLQSGDRQSIRPSVSQVAHTQAKGGMGPGAGMTAAHILTSVGSQALMFSSFAGPYAMMAGPALSMATTMIGGFGARRGGPPKITKVWALPGHNSDDSISTHVPRFEVSFANLVGLDAENYEPFLVKLVQTKDNWRLVGATKTKMSMGMSMGAMDEEALAKVTEDRLAARATRIGPGLVQLEPSEALTPGEYGVVLRPIHAGKRSKGTLGGPAEQNVFYSVWDFSVN